MGGGERAGLSFLSVQRGLGASPCWTNLGAHTPSRDHPQNPAGRYLSSSTSPHSWKTGRSLSSWACVSEAEVSESSSVITAEATLVNTERGQERRGPATASLGLRPSSALPGRPDAVVEGRGFRRPSPALWPAQRRPKRDRWPRTRYLGAFAVYFFNSILKTMIITAVCSAVTNALDTMLSIVYENPCNNLVIVSILDFQMEKSRPRKFIELAGVSSFFHLTVRPLCSPSGASYILQFLLDTNNLHSWKGKTWLVIKGY